jgi:hypothetical protein
MWAIAGVIIGLDRQLRASFRMFADGRRDPGTASSMMVSRRSLLSDAGPVERRLFELPILSR